MNTILWTGQVSCVPKRAYAANSESITDCFHCFQKCVAVGLGLGCGENKSSGWDFCWNLHKSKLHIRDALVVKITKFHVVTSLRTGGKCLSIIIINVTETSFYGSYEFVRVDRSKVKYLIHNTYCPIHRGIRCTRRYCRFVCRYLSIPTYIYMYHVPILKYLKR